MTTQHDPPSWKIFTHSGSVHDILAWSSNEIECGLEFWNGLYHEYPFINYGK